MGFGIDLIITGFLLGIALAMDAFSVSLATGLGEPKMKRGRMFLIAGTFAVFQFVMPLLGRLFVGKLLQSFRVLRKFIPVAAFVILLVLGGKMILEGIRNARKKRERMGDADNTPAGSPLYGAGEHGNAGTTDERPLYSTGEVGSVGITDVRTRMSLGKLIMQGVATSLDALSVGFVVMAEYRLIPAALSCAVIGAVTFVICIAGLLLGRKIGTVLEEKAYFLGGIILISIGVEILLKG